MSSPADLDESNVVDIDLGSAEFKANAHRHMAEWARRPPFYVLGHGQPQVVVGRYADVHKVFSDTQTFASEMPRGPGWEQFNKFNNWHFLNLPRTAETVEMSFCANNWIASSQLAASRRPLRRIIGPR